jgi:hypothetical protein
MRRGFEHRADAEIGAHRSAVPKILGILAVVALVRVLLNASRRSAGSGHWRERRHEAIANMHRQLHDEDASIPA